MNGPMRTTARSVQLAVIATPTASVVEAVAEARRRHSSAAASIDGHAGRMAGNRNLMAAAA
jgi:hypothetical protein